MSCSSSVFDNEVHVKVRDMIEFLALRALTIRTILQLSLDRPKIHRFLHHIEITRGVVLHWIHGHGKPIVLPLPLQLT